MVLLRVIRLVADSAGAAATFMVRYALSRLTSDVSRFLGTQLGMVVMPLAVLAGEQRTHGEGVDMLPRRLGVRSTL